MIKLCRTQDSGLLMKNFSNFGLGKYPNSVLIPSREGFLPLESELNLGIRLVLVMGMDCQLQLCK